jgi:hypothetical protein
MVVTVVDLCLMDDGRWRWALMFWGRFTGILQVFSRVFYLARWPIPLDELHRITGRYTYDVNVCKGIARDWFFQNWYVNSVSSLLLVHIWYLSISISKKIIASRCGQMRTQCGLNADSPQRSAKNADRCGHMRTHADKMRIRCG